MPEILIVEDDTTFAQIIEGFLSKNNYTVEVALNLNQAFKLLDKEQFNLLLVDYRLPDGTGLELLKQVRKNGLTVPIIIMTSFNDVRTAVKSIQLGAFDYITKPINPEELLMVVKGLLTKKEIVVNDNSDLIKGKSAVSDRLYEHIDLVAQTDMSVIIQGESGTGKEFAARTLHLNSKRKDKPFIAVDCGSLSKDLAASEFFGHVKGAFTGAINDKKGQFEMADGGTLFLDEIGNLSYEVQIKLLRALQERIIQPIGSNKQINIDVRILVATNDDLQTSMKTGAFREDLYHRLNEFKIIIPPLRERGKDLELFINHFVHLANIELGRNVETIEAEARDLLLKYDWPGNLRELKNVIKRMVLLSPSHTATLNSLPEEMTIAVNEVESTGSSDLKAINEVNEKNLILETLVKVRYNKSKAAKILNIDRKTLYSKMERYGID